MAFLLSRLAVSGGNGGFSGSLVLQNGGVGAARSMGGDGGTGNAAGNVDVESVGNITTGMLNGVATGAANSSGIVAQSIGGGGGNGGFSLLVSGSYNSVVTPIPQKTVGGNGGTGGIAKDVSRLQHWHNLYRRRLVVRHSRAVCRRRRRQRRLLDWRGSLLQRWRGYQQCRRQRRLGQRCRKRYCHSGGVG